VLDEPLVLDDMLGEEPPVETASMEEEIVELEEPLDLPTESYETRGSNPPQPGENPQFTHQKVVLEDPVSPEKDLESHYHLGVAYMGMELIDQAITEFEAALAFGPKKIDCLVMLGQCYAEKGIPDRSISCLEQALRLQGLTREDFIRINKELAKIYEGCGMKEKAFQAIQRAGLAEHRRERSNP
jgi:tetratricopeptide (TPR) repeat protein